MDSSVVRSVGIDEAAGVYTTPVQVPPPSAEALAEMDAISLERAVAETQSALTAAEANLARTKAGPRPEDVAAAAQAVTCGRIRGGIERAGDGRARLAAPL